MQARIAKAAGFIFDRAIDVIRPFHQSVSWGDRLLTLDKSSAFQNDPAFIKARANVSSSTGQTQYSSPDGISWRFNTLIWAARHCLRIDGDFVECGVFRGDMSWMITENVDLQGAGKRFYLYDTFLGFDPKWSSIADFPECPQFLDFANSEYRAPDIEESVRNRFANKSNVIITKGTVPDVLERISPQSISLLHLDMNSPGAELAALELLFDKISKGGLIIFDDYGWALYRKQKEAADQFAAKHAEIILELPTGQGLLVKH
jgi:O-methyltransferase